MKKFLSFMAAFALCLSLQAQTTSSEDYLRRYNNLVQRVGAAGVGVETLLDKWAADYPDDLEMLLARFSFCFTRSESTQVIQLDRDRYLGNAPILPFTDSLGVKRNYFEDPQYDDDLFSQAEQALNRAIELHPERLDLAFLRVTALTAYEKESPDMALSVLKSIVDRHYKTHPGWVYPGIDRVDDETFKAFIQDYCVSFFRIGSNASTEAFRTLSEHMLSYCKDDPLFMDNIGSYWFVSRKDHKKALKYYNAVLKKHPGDVTAIRNCILLARNEKNVKLEKKYLPMMAKYGETENDRLAAAARLEVLKKKK